MNARPQTQPPQMDSNPLQRALDNYLVMELERDAARQEAERVRTENAQLVAEVGVLREHLQSCEADRRKWQATCTTMFGRLLAISDTIAGAVRQAAQDGLKARDEPGEADAVAAAAAQCAGTEWGTQTAPEPKASPEPSVGVLATVPRNQFATDQNQFRR